MKRLLAILMVIICLASLTACGFGARKPNGQPVSDEDEAREVVETYLTALKNLNPEDAKECFEDESVLADMKGINKDALMAGLPKEFESVKADYESALDLAIAKTKESISYKIEKLEEKNKEYIVKVKITLPKDNIIEKYTGGKKASKIYADLVTSGNVSKEEALKQVFIKMQEEIKDAKIETQEEIKEIIVYKKDGKWVIDTGETTEE